MSSYDELLQLGSFQVTQYLIIPSDPLVRGFLAEIGGPDVLLPMDVDEIITQVIQALLNDDEFTERSLLELPNEDRLLDSNRIERARLQQAVYALGRQLRELLLSFGAYTPEHGFPYIFDRLLGCDIRLQRLGDWT